MKIACLSLAVLLLASWVSSSENVWESDATNYQNVLKGLENEKKESTSEESNEDKKAASPFLSTFYTTQYQTYTQSGEEEVNGQVKSWTSTFVSSWVTSFVRPIQGNDGAATTFSTTYYSQSPVYQTTYQTSYSPVHQTTYYTVSSGGDSQSQSSGSSSSSSFGGSSSSSGSSGSSSSVGSSGSSSSVGSSGSSSSSGSSGSSSSSESSESSSASGGDVDQSQSSEYSYSSSSAFNLNTCGCDDKSLAANQWVYEQLTKWGLLIETLKQQITEWYSQNEQVGEGWLNKAHDDRYELWIEWANYLDQMRSKVVSMGVEKFQQAHGSKVESKLNSLILKLQKRNLARIEEGQNVVEWQNSGTHSEELAQVANYKSKFLTQYQLLSAAIWKRSAKAKFSGTIAPLYRSAQLWYQAYGSEFQWWWNEYVSIINSANEEYESMLGVWSEAIQEHGFSWFLKHGAAEWETSSGIISRKLTALHEVVLVKSSALLQKRKTKGMKDIKKILLSRMRVLFKSFKTVVKRLKTQSKNLVKKLKSLNLKSIKSGKQRVRKLAKKSKARVGQKFKAQHVTDVKVKVQPIRKLNVKIASVEEPRHKSKTRKIVVIDLDSKLRPKVTKVHYLKKNAKLSKKGPSVSFQNNLSFKVPKIKKLHFVRHRKRPTLESVDIFTFKTPKIKKPHLKKHRKRPAISLVDDLTFVAPKIKKINFVGHRKRPTLESVDIFTFKTPKIKKPHLKKHRKRPAISLVDDLTFVAPKIKKIRENRHSKVHLKKTKHSGSAIRPIPRAILKIKRIQSARKYNLRKTRKIVIVTSKLFKKASAFQKKYLPKAKWWTKTYRRVIKTAKKQHKVAVRIATKVIKKRGIKWFKKYAQKKFNKVEGILNKKLRVIHQIILRKTVALLRKSHKISRKVLKKQIQQQVKSLLRRYLLLSRRLIGKLRKFVQKGWRVLIKPSKKISVKGPKVTSKVTKKWKTKFSLKTCKCTKKLLSANKWLSRQLKGVHKILKHVQKRIRRWYKKNQQIGKWWLLKARDDVDEVWVEWATFLERLRLKRIKLGPKRFKVMLKNRLTKIRSTLVSNLKNCISVRIRQGKVIKKLIKNPAFKAQLAKLAKFKPRYRHLRRRLSAKIWRRHQRAKFGAFISKLSKKLKIWYKKQSKNVKFGRKLYRKLINRIYGNFVGVLNTWYKGVKHYGYKWFVSHGRKKYNYFLKLTKKKTKHVVKVFRKKSKAILGTKVGKLSNAVKRRFLKQIKALLRLTVRVALSFNRKAAKHINIGWKLRKVVRKTRPVSHRVRPIFKFKKGKPLVRFSHKHKHGKRKVRHTRKLLGLGHFKIRKLKVKTLIKHRHLKLPRIHLRLRGRIQTKKVKNLIPKLLKIAKRFQIKLLPQAKWWFKTYKRVIKNALKHQKVVARIALKGLKTRGRKWFNKYVKNKVNKIRRILNKKLKTIHRIILRQTIRLLRQKHRLSVVEIKRRVQVRAKKLLRSYLALAKRLTRQLKKFIKRGWKVLIRPRNLHLVIRRSKLPKIQAKITKKWLTKFSLKTCKCTKKLRLANKWVAAQLKYLESHLKPIKRYAQTWYSKNRSIGQWWILKAMDDIDELWMEWTTFLERLRRKYLKIGSQKFQLLISSRLNTILQTLLSNLENCLSVRIRQGTIILRLINHPSYKALVTQFASYKPRFKQLRRKLSAKIWRRNQTAKFGGFILRLVKRAKAWYKKQPKKLRFGYKLYRKLIHRLYGNFVGVLDTWYKGLKQRGFKWFVKYGRKKFRYFLKVTKRKAKRIIKAFQRKSKAILGRVGVKITASVKARFTKQIKALLRSTVRAAKSFNRKSAKYINFGWKLRIRVPRVRPFLTDKRHRGSRQRISVDPVFHPHKHRHRKIVHRGFFGRIRYQHKAIRGFRKLKLPKGKLSKIRRIRLARKWRRKQQFKVKVFLKGCLRRVQRFQKKYLPKAKWFLKIHKRVFKSARKHEKTINKIGFNAIKKHGVKWYGQFVHGKLKHFRNILRKKLKVILRIAFRQTARLLRKTSISRALIKKKVQNRIKKLLRGFNLLSSRLTRQLRKFVKKGWETLKKVRGVLRLTKHKVQLRVKRLKAIVKLVLANKWLAIQLKKLRRTLKIASRPARIFYRRNKGKVGKWFIIKIKNDIAKSWIRGAKFLEKLRKKHISLGAKKFRVLYNSVIKAQLRKLSIQLKKRVHLRLKIGRVILRLGGGKEAQRKRLADLMKRRPQFIQIQRKLMGKIWKRQEKTKFTLFILRLLRNGKNWFRKQTEPVRFGYKFYYRFAKRASKNFLITLSAWSKAIKKHGYRWFVKYAKKKYNNLLKVTKRKTKSLAKAIRSKSKHVLGGVRGRITLVAKRTFLKAIKTIFRTSNRIAKKLRQKARKHIQLAWKLHVAIKLQKTKKQRKLRIKKLRQILIARKWIRHEKRKFKEFATRSLIRIQRFQHKHNFHAAWLLKLHKRLLRTAKKQNKKILHVGFRVIKKRGYKWYTQFAQKKIQRVSRILRNKVRAILRIILRKTPALLKKGDRITLSAIRKKVQRRIRQLLKGLIRLSKRLTREVKRFVKKSLRKSTQVKLRPLKFRIRAGITKKWHTKFHVKTCNCTKKILSANKWLSKQLKKVGKVIKTLKIRARVWFRKHKNVGKWWIRKVNDDIARKWILAVALLNRLRDVRIKLGGKQFKLTYKRIVRNNLGRLLHQLKRLVKLRIRQGKRVLRLKGKPSFRIYLAKLQRFKPRFTKLQRQLSAKIWRRQQISRFGNFILYLVKKTRAWYKKQSKNVRFGIKFHRQLIHRVYGNFVGVANTWYKGIKLHGFKWFIKHGRKGFNHFLKVMKKKTKRVVQAFRNKSKAILGSKVGKLSISVKRRFAKQIKSLLRLTIRVALKFNKKAVKRINTIWKVRKSHKTRPIQPFVKPIIKLTKGRPIRHISGGYKKKKGGFKLLGTGKFRTKKLKFKPLIGTFHKTDKKRRIHLAQRCGVRRTKKVKSLVSKLLKTAKTFQRKHIPQAKWWFKTYKRLVKNAAKQQKAIVKIVVKGIRKRGYKWFNKYVRQKLNKIQRILNKKLKIIHRIVMRKTVALLRKSHKLSAATIKRQIQTRSKTLLRGYISLAKRLRQSLKQWVTREWKVLIKPKKVHPGLRLPKIKARVTKRWLTKFNLKNCKCTKKLRLANKWVASQLKRLRGYLLPYVSLIRRWYRKNRAVGKWWILKATDYIDELWVEYAVFIEELRKKYIQLGGEEFVKVYETPVQVMLQSIIANIKNGLNVTKRQGEIVLRLRHISLSNPRLDRLTKFQPRFKKLRRTLSAKIWRRQQTAKFGGFVLCLVKKTKRWYKKQSRNVRFGRKLHRKLIHRVFGNFVGTLDTWYRGIKQRGYKWFVTYGRKKFNHFVKVTKKKTKGVVKAFRRKSIAILGKTVGKLSLSLKLRFVRQVKSLLRKTIRAAVNLNKKAANYINFGWRLQKTQRIPKLKIKSLVGRVFPKRKPLHIQTRPLKVRKLKTKIHGIHSKLGFQKKTKTLISKLLRNAKKFQSKFIPHAKWWLKTYKKALKTAVKHKKTVVRVAVKCIRKRGLHWYKKFVHPKVKKIQTILNKKLKVINYIIIRKTMALVRKSHRLNANVIKRQIQIRVQRLLKGYISLAKRLKQRLQKFINGGWKVLIKVKKPHVIGRGSKLPKIKAQLTKKWLTKFSVKTCKCSKKLRSANKWVSRQFKRLGNHVKTFVRHIALWYKQNKSVGKWWILKAADSVDELWVEWIVFIERLREKYIELGAERFEEVYGTPIKLMLQSIIYNVQNGVSLNIRQGQIVLRLRDISAFNPRLDRFTKYTPRFKKLRRSLTAKIWRRQQTAKFGYFIRRLVKKMNKWYKKQSKNVKIGYKLYRKLTNRVFGNFVGVLQTWYKGIKRHGYKWFVKFARKKFNHFVKVAKKTAKRVIKAFRRKSKAILGRKHRPVSRALLRKFVSQVKSLFRVTVRVAIKFNRRTAKYINIGWKLRRVPKLVVRPIHRVRIIGKGLHGTRRPTKPHLIDRRARFGHVSYKHKHIHRRSSSGSLSLKTKERRILKIRRVISAKKWRRKHQQKLKIFLSRRVRRVQQFQKKYLPKVKWFMKINRRILKSAKKYEKVVAKISFKVIKKRGSVWYAKYAKEKVSRITGLLRQKVKTIQNIILRKTAALVRKGGVTMSSLRKKLQERIKRLLRGYKHLAKRLARQLKQFLRKGWNSLRKVHRAQRLTKRKVRLNVKTIKAAKKAIAANLWLLKQLKKLGRATRLVTRPARVFYKKNKSIGKWFIRKVRNDIAKVWITGATFLEKLRRKHILLGSRKFRAVYGPRIKSKLNKLYARLKRRIAHRFKQVQLVRQMGRRPEFQERLSRLLKCRPHLYKIQRKLAGKIWHRQERAKFTLFVLRLLKRAKKWFKNQPKNVKVGYKYYRRLVTKIYRSYMKTLSAWSRAIKRHGYRWFSKYGKTKYYYFLKVTKRKTKSAARAVQMKSKHILGRKSGKVPAPVKRKFVKIMNSLVKSYIRVAKVLRQKVKNYISLGWSLHKTTQLRQAELKRQNILKLPKRVSTVKKYRQVVAAHIWRREAREKFKAFLQNTFERVTRFTENHIPDNELLLKLHNKIARVVKKQHSKVTNIGFRAIKKRGPKWYNTYAKEKVESIKTILRKKLQVIQEILLRKTAALLRKRSKVTLVVLRKNLQRRVNELLKGYSLLASRLRRGLRGFIKRGWRNLIKAKKYGLKLKLTPNITTKWLTKFSVKTCKCTRRIVSANRWLSKQLKKLRRSIKAFKRQARVWYRKNKSLGRWWMLKVKDDLAQRWIRTVTFLNRLRKQHISLGARKFKAVYSKLVNRKLNLLRANLAQVIAARIRQGKYVLKVKGNEALRGYLSNLITFTPRFRTLKRKLSAKLWRRHQIAKFGNFLLGLTKKMKSWYRKQSKNVRKGYSLYQQLVNRQYGNFVGVVDTWYKGVQRLGYKWLIKNGRRKFNHFRKVLKNKTKLSLKIFRRLSKLILGAKVVKLTVSHKRRFKRRVRRLMRSTLRAAIKVNKIVYNFIRVERKLVQILKKRHSRPQVQPTFKGKVYLGHLRLPKPIKTKKRILLGKMSNISRIPQAKVHVSKKIRRTRSARKFFRKQSKKLKVLLYKLFNRAKVFQQKYLPKRKWWLKTYKQVIKTALKRNTVILKLTRISIRKRGKKWYKQYARRKVNKINRILKSKIQIIHRIILRKTAALLRKSHKMSRAVFKMHLQTGVKKHLLRYKQLAKRLTRQLRRYIKIGWLQVQRIRQQRWFVHPGQRKVSAKVTKKWLTKFSLKTCKCTKKLLSANRWLAKQLKKVGKIKMILRRRVRGFYKRNKKVGKWWIVKANDLIAKRWIEGVKFFTNLRQNHIHLGAKKFKLLFNTLLKAKRGSLIGQMKRAIVFHIRQGKLVLKLRGNPVYKSRLAQMTKYKPKYTKLERKLSAKFWLRNQKAKFGAFVLHLSKKAKAWYKKQPKNVKFGYKLYRRLINRLYGNYIGILNTWYKGVKLHGFKWYVKFGRRKYIYFLKVTKRKTKSFVRTLLGKSKTILGQKGGKLTRPAKLRFLRQANILLKTTVRVAKSFNRKVANFINTGAFRRPKLVKRPIAHSKTTISKLSSVGSQRVKLVAGKKGSKKPKVSRKQKQNLQPIILNLHLPLHHLHHRKRRVSHVKFSGLHANGDHVECTCQRVGSASTHSH
jgi:hypothetical protein